MGKLKLSTRDIGMVKVFDLEGSPTQETVQEIAWKIQKSIRRYRLQRVILNLQHLHTLDPLGLRKLLAACIRPQRSVIFGASTQLRNFLEDSYLPRNVRICSDEKEVAEDLGTFLLERNEQTEILLEEPEIGKETLGHQIERRRSKRMHVAIPLELKVFPAEGDAIMTRAIATNISEGGVFIEYLDLEAATKIENLKNVEGMKAEIQIFPSANFPEEYHLMGRIKRKDLRKKQLGLAVEFQDKISA